MITTWAELAAMYEEELRIARKRFPTEYYWPERDIPTVVGKMLDAFKTHTYSNAGHGIRGVARRLKIKPTYTELNALFATLQ